MENIGLMALGRLHDQDLMVIYLLDGPREVLYIMVCEFSTHVHLMLTCILFAWSFRASFMIYLGGLVTF